MKKIGLFIIMLFVGVALFAQDVAFDKKNFPTKKNELKEVKKGLKAADKIMKEPFPSYFQALEYYLRAQDLNPNNAQNNFNIGICYLNSMQKFRSLEYFENAYRLNKNVSPDIEYYLGRGNHLLKNWEKAISHYTKYKNTLLPGDNGKIKDVDKKIQECYYGIEFVANPVNVIIENMGSNVNSEFSDYGLVLTADASEVFYTSRRPNTTGGKISDYDGTYYEDVYWSKRNANGEWEPAVNIGAPINTKGHDAVVALSPDGGKMILYMDDNGDGNLYESIRKGNTWSRPKKFNREINSPFHEASAWYTPDGKYLYFTSERPLDGNVKGQSKDRDIYVAEWDAKAQRWLNVKRLPDNINSEYDEDAVFIHPDGVTMYFSSRGHNSMGGYDIFKTVLQADSTWSDPVNMGYPINTPDDDVFFTVAANGIEAFLTSFREDGLGEKDLYTITLLDNKKPILQGQDMLLANEETAIQIGKIESLTEGDSKLMILKGVIRDAKTKEPLKASIELTDNDSGKLIANVQSDPVTGKYFVTLPGGKDYGLAVKSNGYLFHSENFNVKEAGKYTEVDLDVDLNKVEVGSTIALRNVFFDYNKYSLRPISITELNRVIEIMNDYPNMKIELSGHTDTRGSATYNKTLSENRAKAVLEYLVEHGIDRNRLVSKGYGYEKTMISDAEIAKMKTNEEKEDAHQQNRRTELKIIEM